MLQHLPFNPIAAKAGLTALLLILNNKNIQRDMRILHICNGYTQSLLYDELFKRLARLGYEQDVIAPTFIGYDHGVTSEVYKIHRLFRKNSLFERIWFSKKIKGQVNYANRTLEMPTFDLIHAHTLFSDGSVAYELGKLYNKSYIVSIRNTDINFFFPKFFHLRRKAYKILREAYAVVLISPSYKIKLQKILPKDVFESIRGKIIIIPNGISNSWLENHTATRQLHCPVHLVFCGAINRNKNLDSIIKACRLANKNIPLKLTIVGRKYGQNDKYCRIVERMAGECTFDVELLPQTDREHLINLYKNCDIFVMPSHHETFGLVYAEALSQGLPVIYTRGEGFDGFFEDRTVGCAVNSRDISQIADAIVYCVDNYSSISEFIKLTRKLSTSIERFNWDNITAKYNTLYSKIR